MQNPTDVEQILRAPNSPAYIFATDHHQAVACALGWPEASVGLALANFEYGDLPPEITSASLLWATDLPAPVDPKLKRDRDFYDKLGPEDPTKPCKRPDCNRGAIQFGTRCKRHHFEMIHGRECPFE